MDSHRDRLATKLMSRHFGHVQDENELRRQYLIFCQFLVIELICSIAVFVVQEFHLSGTRIFRILNKFLENEKQDTTTRQQMKCVGIIEEL